MSNCCRRVSVAFWPVVTIALHSRSCRSNVATSVARRPHRPSRRSPRPAVRASPPRRRRMPSRMRRSSRRSPRRSLPRPAALRRPVLRRLPRRPTSARRCDLVSIPIHTGDPQRIARMCFSGRMQAGASVCQRRSERSGQGEESASGGGESRRSMNSDLSYGGQIVPAEDVCCVGRR